MTKLALFAVWAVGIWFLLVGARPMDQLARPAGEASSANGTRASEDSATDTEDSFKNGASSLGAEAPSQEKSPGAGSPQKSAASTIEKRAPAAVSAPQAVPAPPMPRIILPPSFNAAASSSASALVSNPVSDTQKTSAEPPTPTLDEEAIFRAVVKIECPSEDRKGKYVGSGFVLARGVVVTAAHLIKDSGSDTCRVIFPRNRAPAYFLSGATEDRERVMRRHDENGIDVAFLFLPTLAQYPEARAVFPDGYPTIPYPVCQEPDILGHGLLHFGYPASFQDQSYLSRAEGRAVSYADIGPIREILSEDQTFLFKTPEFSYTRDESRFHPYAVSRVSTFYGDSGGLAFDATRQCVLGPHRGGTIGGGAGENFSVFSVLAWDGAPPIIPPP